MHIQVRVQENVKILSISYYIYINNGKIMSDYFNDKQRKFMK